MKEINTCYLSRSKSPIAMCFLKRNPIMISWSDLSKNPIALVLLEKNIEKVIWRKVCDNPKGILLFEKYPDNIVSGVSARTDSMSLLENYPSKINW